MKRKDTDQLEKMHRELSGSVKDKVMRLLMQLAVYHQVNN